MTNQQISLEEHVKNMLKFLYAMGPASNLLTQFLFILPEKAVTLVRLYPEVIECEDVMLEILSLRYDSKGFLEHQVGGLGEYIIRVYQTLFSILANKTLRAKLLKLAKLSEEEFKRIDPLRAWIEVSLDFLAKTNRSALKLLSIVITLSEKSPSSASFEEVKKEAEKSGIENVDELLSLLHKRLKLFDVYYSPISYKYYVNQCPLILDVYADLRKKLDELINK